MAKSFILFQRLSSSRSTLTGWTPDTRVTHQGLLLTMNISKATLASGYTAIEVFYSAHTWHVSTKCFI